MTFTTTMITVSLKAAIRVLKTKAVGERLMITDTLTELMFSTCE